MRNEAPFLLEWVAHLKALGVTDFLIFTNECDDGTDILLDHLADQGEVIHIRQDQTETSVQWQALNAAWRHPLRKDVDWAMCIDCDEFINLRAPFDTLVDLIDAVGDADAIALPWRFFGHSFHLAYDDVPVIDRFSFAIPAQVTFPLVSKFFKTLVRIKSGPFAKLGVHRPKTKTAPHHPPKWVSGSGTALPVGFAQNDKQLILPDGYAGRDWVQLNHYSLRSLEDFLVKRQRGLPNRTGKQIDALYWAERNFNTVQDTTIQRHRSAMIAQRERLLTHPNVAAAHKTAVQLHRAKIATLLEDPDQVTLFTRLALLSSSQPPGSDQAARLLDLTAKSWTKRVR
jgi:hypothetical protein